MVGQAFQPDNPLTTHHQQAMNLMHGTAPFPWWVFDNWCEPVPLSAIPGMDDPIWEACYANDCESGKRTTRDPEQLGEEVRRIWDRLRASGSEWCWSCRVGQEVWHDPTVHGGGLHVTTPGGWLNVHLDYDVHPHLPGFTRKLNLIAFIHPEWREEWGGALVLCDPMGGVVKRISPEPGRLVAFECSDVSYHGVEEITGPMERVSLAAYLLTMASGLETRKRALFMPSRARSDSHRPKRPVPSSR